MYSVAVTDHSSSAPHPERSRVWLDLSPLRESPEFARLWVGTSVAQIGAQVTIVAVGLHVFALTGSTLAVAAVALWALVPMILSGFVGGALADRYDRRTVAVVTALVAWLSIAAMALCAFQGVSATWPYYLLAAVNAAAATVMGATRGAMVPRLLPIRLLPAASALSGITMGLSATVGPALAGVLVATVGFSWTYLLDFVLFAATFVGLWGLPVLKPEGVLASPGWRSITQSFAFLRTAPNVRATFVFDLVAMVFGSPRVIFPAVGTLVLGGGAVTVGALTASFAFGALLSGIFSGPLGQVRRQGRAVTLAIAVYGGCIALLGVVLAVTMLTTPERGFAAEVVWPGLIASCVALAGAGAADNVSSVFRSTILQAAAPDDVRGRMQGLFYVVVAGGPRLGDLLAGALATVIAVWAPALLGGCAIVGVMWIAIRRYGGFQRYDALHPTP